MEHIITAGEELRKSFHENGFAFLSSVPQRRIQEMILAMAQKGYSGKITDYYATTCASGWTGIIHKRSTTQPAQSAAKQARTPRSCNCWGRLR